MSSDTQSIEEFSGIEQPSLLEQIKRILDEYRNDVQIIKELIQNADDAEATSMKILYEGKTINPEQENEAEYRKFLRAPALVFYNDKTFTEDDWRGIRSIYTSVKRDDPLKIGRFGLGFKSVFHLTDFPCIISGENALFINPHASEFGRICVMVKLKHLKEWHRLNNEDYMNSLVGTFGFSEDTLSTGMYNGTMFWFPLRQCPSPLSDNTYQEENVLNLLQAFITESHRSLLFLKTLCSIKLFVNMQDKETMFEKQLSHTDDSYKELDSMNFGKETEYFTVEVSNKSDDLSQKRQVFLRELQDIGSEVPDQSKQWVFDITIQTVTKSSLEDKKVAKSRWLIVNYLKGGEISEKLGQLMKDKELGYPHIVGLAAPIDTHANYSSTAGHVFCYQPLPQENIRMTGLPVHVNGFFALSQNRRHVRWPDQGDSTNGQGDKKIEWNIVLRTQILPEAYERLLVELISLCQEEENPEFLLKAVYNAVPDLSVVDDHWSDLAIAVPELCKNMEILYTKQDGGKWIRPQEAVFANTLKCIEYQAEDNNECHENQKDVNMETVIDLLLSDNVNVVDVPRHIADAFNNACSVLTYATPAYLKLHMESHETYKDLDTDRKQEVFEFIMLESSREGLELLELLPLEDGTFQTFAPGKRVIFERKDVIEKFPGQESNFVRADLRPSTITLLKDLADKGTHCIQRLCDDTAAKMVKDILMKSFGEKDIVHINSSEVKRWKPWVRGIWGLIQDRFRNSVKSFSDMSIFPKVPSSDWEHVAEFSLLMLSAPILHMPSLAQLEDMEYINRSFELLSISIIDNIPEYLEAGLVSTFLHEETSESITALLDRVNLQQVEKFNSEYSDECSAAFLKFLSERIHTNIGNTGRRILQEMKLFRGHKAINESDLVSLKDMDDVYRGKHFPVRFPSQMILLKTDAEAALAKQLCANMVSDLELVRRTLRRINEYTPDEKQRFIFWIITNEEHFKYHDVQESLKTIAFLEAEDGSFYKASELFDPTDELLLDMFRHEQVFPKRLAEPVQNVLYFNGLRSIGLKTAKDLTCNDIEHVCDVVHRMTEGEVSIDKEKCLALLDVMNKHGTLVRKGNICNKRCIIIEDTTFEDAFPQSIQLKNRCKDSSVLVCMPSEIHSVKHVHLVGTVLFMIDCKRLPALSKIFEWEARPNVTKVVEHLFNVVKNYQPKHKASYLPVVTSIYEWLSTQEECSTEELKDIFQQQFVNPFDAFVWDGNLFQPITNMYAIRAKGDVDLRPFLHPLPSETEHLADFFQFLGCQKSIQFDTYVDTLHRIKSSEQLASNDDSLSETLTEMSIAILNKIKKNFLDEFCVSEKQLYFPTMTENGGIQMMPAKSCTFCDEQWLKNMDFQLDDDVHYVHPELPVATAEILGVPSLRQQMMSDTEAFAEWGQEEPLTRRLRNLLKEGYVDGFSVAKELFQNADDAGAKKLWILFDERENNEAKTHLISEGMAECQGPAIWVYNDAKFTESDFRNITKLSGATKEDDSTKIGKFGLGFCAVYNITDVPSFASGESIVFFDPDMSHLGKVLPGRSPGLRVDFKKMSNLKMLKSLKNQFMPFEGVFDCSIIGSASPFYDGTLFRLPLRNRASDISDVVYSSSEVKCLFEKIMSMAANMLLFNQNVEEFKLLHIPKTERNPANAKLLFEINKNTIRLETTNNERLNGTMLVEASRRKQNQTMLGKPLQVIDKVSVNICNYVDSKFHVLVDKLEAKEDWLISWSTGIEGKTINLAYEEKGALPLGSVAIPVKTATHGNVTSLDILPMSGVSEQFYQRGHLFFFLPLPIQHRFPFHINSQFTVTTDRRQLRTSTEDDKNVKMTKWNKYLLKDSVTQALLYLLEHLHSFGSLEGYQYDSLWPRQETAEILENLPLAFYRSVVKPNKHNVFEKNGQWFDISKCVFIEKHFRSSAVGDTVFEVLSMLTDFVVDISEDVYEMLLQANQPLIEEKTVSEERFFLEYLFPNLEELSSDNCLKEKIKQLLYHATDLQNDTIDKWLKENKCIPSQPNGSLKRPNELIDTYSDLAALFVVADGYFPECPFADRHMSIKLRKLGLMYNILPDSLVVDRATSIECMHTRCSVCAVERAGHFLGYLCDNISQHRSIISELGNLRFIPVQAKPMEWIFEWHADMFTSKKAKRKCKTHKNVKGRYQTSHFDRPSNVYYSDCKTIVACVAFVFDENSYFMYNTVNKSRGLRDMLKAIGMNGLTKMDIDIEFILQQLECVATSYGNVAKETTSFDVSGTLFDIYRHLDKACKSKSAFDSVAAATRGKAIVFVSDKFVLPKAVARYCYWDCKPYLFWLKDSPLEKCSTLCDCFSITDYFQPYDIASLLHDIKQDKNDTPLSLAEIRTVINIMYCLQSSIYKLHNKTFEVQSIVQDQIDAIYGPDENGILRDCKSMCFNDYDELEKSKSMIYAHISFPPDLAKFFGVNPKLIHTLEECSEDIEDFFQDEPLVTRLNRLVEGYPCDSGIFKELIQNADDANATEIHFVKDFTTHPSTSIIDPQYGALQGPALVVFNDSAFSNDDLKGITKLGRGSKSDDPSQTGRYGVGFNAVYNLTDAPSFYTKGGEIENGETLCFFDPLAKYLPNVTRKRPGKRCKDVNLVRSIYSNMMSGYHEEFLIHGTKGTVFRFPLRTQEMAETSDIKSEAVGIDMVSELLAAFSEEISNVLIFLKNLRTVKISSYKENHFTEEFSINVEMNATEAGKRDAFVKQQIQFCETFKRKRENVFQSEQYEAIYELSMTVRNGTEAQEYDFFIAQVLGFHQNIELNQTVKDKLSAGKIGLLPHGGVALRAKKRRNSYRNIQWETDIICKAFCFLPLPIETGLPVHVHGYFALDHETRRTLWRSDKTETCYKTLWNNMLLEHVVAKAYVCLLKYTKSVQFQGITETSLPDINTSLTSFQTLFPLKGNVSDNYWKHLLCCVYQLLVTEHVDFLPVQNVTRNTYVPSEKQTVRLTWTPLRVEGSKYPAYVKKEDVYRDRSLNSILRRIGMRIAFISDEIREAMEYSNVGISCLKPEHVIAFIASSGGNSTSTQRECKIEKGKHIIQTALQFVPNAADILEYCLKDLQFFEENLKDIPLMITHDSIVRTVPESGFFYVEKDERFCDFFPTKRHQFVHSVIAKVVSSKLTDANCFHGKLKRFSLTEFVSLMQETKQIDDGGTSTKIWNKTNPSESWIRLFWEYFCSKLPDDSKGSVAKHLQIIRHLPLLPVHKTSSNDMHLMPPYNIKSLMNLRSFINNETLYTAMKRLNLPQLSQSFFGTSVASRSYELLLAQAANSFYPIEILDCLHLNACQLAISNLSHGQINAILWHFNDCPVEQFSNDAAAKLKELPLFLSHFGKRLMLKHYRTIYIVPNMLPTEGLEDIADKANVLFLRNTGHKKLFKLLKIEHISLIHLYAQYIVPKQHLLERKCFYKHLAFLSDSIVVGEEKEVTNLLSILRNTAFVEIHNGHTVRVCELFDSDHIVFQRMCQDAELVPDCLRKASILELFRKIGLKTEMTMPLYERFARSIESKGKRESLSKCVIEDAKLLTTHLLRRSGTFFAQENFDQLTKIRFITPFVVDKTLSDIKEQYNCHTLICFEGAVLNSSSNASWTVSNILPVFADPSTKSNGDLIVQKLKISKLPCLKNMLRHCELIGKSLEKIIGLPNIVCHKTLKNIMSDIYHALNTFLDSGQLTDEAAETLANVPIVYYPDTKIIVTAKRVVMVCRSDEEIPPYLLKCPETYLAYKQLFLRLGTSQETSCDSFACVLKELKDVSKDTELVPDEYWNALRAIGNLFKHLAEQKDIAVISVGKLYLLSCNETLEDARTLIVPNNQYFKKQLAKCDSIECLYLIGFEKLHEYHLKTEDCITNLQHLPQKYRPHLLTEAVKERVILENIKSKDRQISSLYKDFWHCNDFVCGFLRLTRHVWKSENRQLTKDDECHISKTLKSIDVRHCSGIETKLALRCIENGNLGREMLVENTNEKKFIHIELYEDNACVFFDTAEDNWNHNVTKHLTIYLNGLVGKCLKDEFFVILMELVSKVNMPESIDLFLSKEKIEEYTLQYIELDKSPSCPTPGDIVPKKYHQYLDNGYGIIYEHDYKFIALEVDDPVLDLNESEEDEGKDEQSCNDLEPTYKFVHIIGKVGPENELPLFQEYEINCGLESTLTVKAFKLFKFIRKEENRSASVTTVEIYERKTDEQPDELRNQQTKSLKEAYSEIRKYLREAWQKGEEERRGIVKRLYRKWHPDKNPDNIQFCTKVFQYLQQCVRRLEEGLELEDDDGNETDSQSNDSSWNSHGSYGNTWYDRYWYRYSRSKYYNERSYNSFRQTGGHTSSTYTSFDDTWRYRETHYEPYHWYSRARLWYTQAELDLRNAKESMEQMESPQFNWVCYNAHQAAEKAMKAAWYAKDANKIDRVRISHNMVDIARDLGSSIEALASQISDLTGEHTRMRYPDAMLCRIPAEAYSKQTARSVIEVAQKLLKLVKSNYIKY